MRSYLNTDELQEGFRSGARKILIEKVGLTDLGELAGGEANLR